MAFSVHAGTGTARTYEAGGSRLHATLLRGTMDRDFKVGHSASTLPMKTSGNQPTNNSLRESHLKKLRSSGPATASGSLCRDIILPDAGLAIHSLKSLSNCCSAANSTFQASPIWMRNTGLKATTTLLQNRHGRQWGRLMVLKSDVAKFWPLDEAAGVVYPLRSGAPGRPTSMHLVEAKFDARCARSEVASSLAEEARYLADWLRSAHPNAPPLTDKTIKNNLRAAYRQHNEARN